VLERLPEGWDEFRTFDVQLEPGKPRRGYASAFRFEAFESGGDCDEARSEQTWVVTFHPEWLDGFNDLAVMWTIAHELGHVASGCRCGSLVMGGRPMTRVRGLEEESYREVTAAEQMFNERMADAIARAWGFWREEEAFEKMFQDAQ